MRNLTETNLEQLTQKLNELSTAHESPVFYVETPYHVPASEYKAIVNDKTGVLETIASKGYVIIQHKDAFGAVLDAVKVSAKPETKFYASTHEEKGRAWMSLVFSDAVAKDDKDGIMLGIRATNSYDKTCALKYSGKSKDNAEGRFEFFGVRMSNMAGMTVSIPLQDVLSKAEMDALNKTLNNFNVDEAKFVENSEEDNETTTPLKKELVVPEHQAKSYIRHYGKQTALNVQKVKLMMLALPAVARRLEEKIGRAQKAALPKDLAEKRLQEIGFGPRTSAKILERYKTEDQSAWGLYNATSAYATHDAKVSALSMERTLKMAERIMEVA